MTPDDQALQSSNPFDQIDPTENEVNYKPATPPAAPVNPFDAAVASALCFWMGPP